MCGFLIPVGSQIVAMYISHSLLDIEAQTFWGHDLDLWGQITLSRM